MITLIEKYIEVENGSLWTKKVGQGMPVLLISGGPGMCNYLEPVSTLIENICEVILFDPKGCGRSRFDGDDGYDLKSCIDDMEAIRRAYGYEKWVVIGHSWGADIGLAYTLLYPQSIEAFVSISGTGIQNDRDWKEAYNQNKMERKEAMPDFLFEVNKTVHRSLINSWRTFIKKTNLLKQLSQLEVATLFIFAEKDIRPSWPIQQLAALINDAQYIEMPNAGHYIWLGEKEREQLAKILHRFIEGFYFPQHLDALIHKN